MSRIPAKFPLRDLRNDAAENPHILLHQVQPRLPGLLVRPGSDNDDGGVRDIVIIPGIDFHGPGKGDSVGHIQSLAFRLVPVGIQQHQFRKQAALHETEGGGGSHKPRIR